MPGAPKKRLASRNPEKPAADREQPPILVMEHTRALPVCQLRLTPSANTVLSYQLRALERAGEPAPLPRWRHGGTDPDQPACGPSGPSIRACEPHIVR